MSQVRFDTSELLAAADRLKQAGRTVDKRMADVFAEWAAEAYEIMREEVPFDEGDLQASIEIVMDGPLAAEIYPTLRVDGASGDHNLGFIIEYGAGNRPPNPFIMRTRERAMELAEAFVPDIDELL